MPFVCVQPMITSWSRRAEDLTQDKTDEEDAGPCCVDDRRRGRDTGRVISSMSASSAPSGYRFPREVIAVAVRWYLRYGLSYRDVEEVLGERGIEVDHVPVDRWVQTFTSEFIDAARPSRRTGGDRWFVDETYNKVAGRWIYLYRTVDQHGQVIDVLVSTCREPRLHARSSPTRCASDASR